MFISNYTRNFFKGFIYLFLEGKDGREGEKYQCVVLSRGPHWGSGLQPRHVPWLGIEPATLWFAAHSQSTELHHPGLITHIIMFKDSNNTEKGKNQSQFPLNNSILSTLWVLIYLILNAMKWVFYLNFRDEKEDSYM